MFAAALQPDLLLVDLVIGQQAGWDLLERLQGEAVTHAIPVVVVSTDPRLLDRDKAAPERYGGHAFVAKPFDVHALLETITAVLGSA